jgi:hypothetical protein
MCIMTIRFGTDGGPGHVYSDTALVTVVDGIVTRKLSGIDRSWEPMRPLVEKDVHFGYGEPWATVDGVDFPFDAAVILAGLPAKQQQDIEACDACSNKAACEICEHNS